MVQDELVTATVPRNFMAGRKMCFINRLKNAISTTEKLVLLNKTAKIEKYSNFSIIGEREGSEVIV